VPDRVDGLGGSEDRRDNPERVTGSRGYHWAYEKVGFAVKSSEKYYAKVKATDKCAGARSPVLNAVGY
jgi:hypothetical protein